MFHIEKAVITSPGNRQVRELRELMAKNSIRRKRGLYTVEGVKLFMEAPRDLIKAVYLSGSLAGSLSDSKGNPIGDSGGFGASPDEGLFRKLEGLDRASVEVIGDDIFRRITDTKTPQGVITLMRIPSGDEAELFRNELRPDTFLVVLESIQDPGNLGTIIRSAEAAGATGVIIGGESADPYGPKAVRATAGSIFRMPVYQCPDLCHTVKLLKDRGVRAFAAHLKGVKSHTEFSYREPSMFLIGNEGRGLSGALADLSDEYMRIPMEGRVESLNASLAATIIMYEVHRQRG